MSNVIKHSPAVFVVGNDYQIFIPVAESCLMWVRVGEREFYDHSNGVMRSDTSLHRITVPMKMLDREGKYTVCLRKMIERLPYFSKTGDVEEVEYPFYPLPEDTFRIFHIADAHGMVSAPVLAAKRFEAEYGKINALFLNGDVINHSGSLENFDTFFEICEGITAGSLPVVFSRGNHDTRGIYAEKIADYSPTRVGYSYFSFRLGSLWGLVLDCGEDKDDSHPEYGNTNCCHAFRAEQTEYVESIVKNASYEYEAEGVKNRIVMAHVPFSHRFSAPFNIEEDTYTYWCRLLREHIKPEVMICGHTHKLSVSMPGDETDALGAPCPVVVASEPSLKAGTFIGGGFIFDNGTVRVVFCDGEKIIKEELLIK